MIDAITYFGRLFWICENVVLLSMLRASVVNVFVDRVDTMTRCDVWLVWLLGDLNCSRRTRDEDVYVAQANGPKLAQSGQTWALRARGPNEKKTRAGVNLSWVQMGMEGSDLELAGKAVQGRGTHGLCVFCDARICMSVEFWWEILYVSFGWGEEGEAEESCMRGGLR